MDRFKFGYEEVLVMCGIYIIYKQAEGVLIENINLPHLC